MTILVAAGLFYSWQSLQEDIQQDMQNKSQSDIMGVITKISEHMFSYSQLLKGGRSLFHASDKVTRQEWHNYIAGLELNKRYPGIQGVGFAVAIRPPELAEHIREIKSEGFDSYHVWPEGKRDFYSSILYLEPFDWRNQRAFGYDMFNEPVRREAMERARDTGNPTLTRKVLLGQETNDAAQAGALLYVAVYRKGAPLESVQQRRDALIGWVYSLYRMDNLFNGIIGQLNDSFHLHIYDNESGYEHILYDSSGTQENDPKEVLINKTLPFEVAGRTWLLSFNALPNYGESVTLDWKMTSELLIGLLLILLTWNLFNTQRKAAALANTLTSSLRKREAEFRLIVESSPLPIAVNDKHQNIILLNKRFTDLIGYTLSDIPTLSDWWSHAYPDPNYRQHVIQTWQENVEESIRNNTEFKPLEYNVTCKDGSVRDIQFSMSSANANDIVVMQDLTNRKAAEKHIEKLAHFDQLTGLPNRTLLQDRFKYLLSLAKRNNQQLAVMFFDLDHFKNVNDSLGHTIGDQLLKELSKVLKNSLREEDTIARLGGDEFIIILPNVGADGATQVASKLLQVTSEPIKVGIHELISTASIGISIYPDDGNDSDTLQKNADSAMYHVKGSSRNGFSFFTPNMQAHSLRTLELSNALRYALKNNELHLHYQPQVSMLDGRIIGMEALLRWNHPELGAISPAEFIPIAEDSGQIISIGKWVLRTACAQLKSWLDKDFPPMIMAVNLSAIQFRHTDIVNMVTDILNEVKLPYEYLELELTESVTMGDPNGAIKVMNQLHAKGIRMSIDDFGTGFSSLAYLKQFKVYKLKIDQSFVRDVTSDLDDQAIVTTIIKMAQSLGMQTIAEGVETIEQLNFLRAQGCDEIQGYYFSKPLSPEQLEEFVRNK